MIGPDRAAYIAFLAEKPRAMPLTDDTMFALMAAKYGLKEAAIVMADITKHGAVVARKNYLKRSKQKGKK